MKLHFTRRIFQKWSSTSQKMTSLQLRFEIMSEQHLKRLEFQSFELMMKTYTQAKKCNTAHSMQSIRLKRKVFKYFKSQAEIYIIPKKKLAIVQKYH